MKAKKARELLKITAYQLKRLVEEGLIKANKTSRTFIDYDDDDVIKLRKRLYYKKDNDSRKANNIENFKPKKTGRKTTFDPQIGSIGKGVITLLNEEGEKNYLNARKNTPVIRKKPKTRERFTQKKFLQVHQEYNFLKNIGLIRRYIQKKHDINLALLESILYLFALEYFTEWDYSKYPHDYSYRTAYLENGELNKLIEIAVNATNKTKNIYTLKKKYKKIVIEFYELLAGVKEFEPELAKRKNLNNRYIRAIQRLENGKSNSDTAVNDACLYLSGKVIDA